MTPDEMATMQQAFLLLHQLNERMKEATNQLGILSGIATLVLEYKERDKTDFYAKVQDLFLDYADLSILSEIKTVSDLQKHFGGGDGKQGIEGME